MLKIDIFSPTTKVAASEQSPTNNQRLVSPILICYIVDTLSIYAEKKGEVLRVISLGRGSEYGWDDRKMAKQSCCSDCTAFS
jgi:hypothetical protein